MMDLSDKGPALGVASQAEPETNAKAGKRFSLNTTALSIADQVSDYGIMLKGPLIANGKWHSTPTVDKPKSRNGRYRVLQDGNVLVQNHRTMDRPVLLRANRHAPRPSGAQRATWHAAARARQQELHKQHLEAAHRAESIWADLPEADLGHPYLVRKHLASAYGVRQDARGNLVIPFGADGRIWTLQTIGADGSKFYMRGGRMGGCYHFVAGAPTGEALVTCEGLANGFSIFEATGLPVVVAGNAGNLKSVALTMRRRFLRTQIILAADNDVSGVGQTKAREAAKAIEGQVVLPPSAGQDFNDIHVTGGLEAVAVLFAGVRHGLR